MSPDDGFIFTGSAVALGARLDEPRTRAVRGSIILPDVGGTADVREEAADIAGIVRFRSATTSVTGERYDYRRDDGPPVQFETRVACTMEGFEYGDAVRADFISATLVSTFLDHHRFHEETVTLRGLWADGNDRIVERRTPKALEKGCRTFEELMKAASGCNELVTDVSSLRSLAGRPMPDPGKLVLRNDRLVCYLFDPSHITFVKDGIRYQLILGEYVLDHQQRRLTMLRVESRLDEGGGGSSKKGPAPKSGAPTPRADEGGGGPQGSTTAVQPVVNGHRPP